jgi:branched-subunit amino acid ABC-type transport system permease component
LNVRGLPRVDARLRPSRPARRLLVWGGYALVLALAPLAFDYSLATLAQQIGLPLSAGVAGNSYVKLTLSQVAPILPYLFLVLILIFRPRGLLGKREG